jgi:large subunit ribosomal protein L24
MKIKKNDNVMIIAGKDKGKTGVVERVFPSMGKLVVKGIALAKKHVKPSKKNPSGGIIDINQKIEASNAMVVCPSCGKPTRVGYNVSEKGKIRICKKCSQSVEGGTK